MTTPTIRNALDTFEQAANSGNPVYLSSAIVQELREALEAGSKENGLPPGYIDPEHVGEDRELLATFYRAADAEGGTADEINLRGIRAVLARWGTPAAAPVPAPAPVPEEVGELVTWLHDYTDAYRGYIVSGKATRTVTLLQQQAAELAALRGVPAPEPGREGPVLQWTDNMPPCEACRYDHCIAETPFGRFLITWKSWKDVCPTVDETPWGDWLGAFDSVDDAKTACQQEINKRLARWCGPVDQPVATPTIRAAQTSDHIPPGPFSEDDLRQQWNAQADEFNPWDSLDTCEQLAWAQACAITAGRCARDALNAEQETPTDEQIANLAEEFCGDPLPTVRRALELWGAPAALSAPHAGEGEA